MNRLGKFLVITTLAFGLISACGKRGDPVAPNADTKKEQQAG